MPYKGKHKGFESMKYDPVNTVGQMKDIYIDFDKSGIFCLSDDSMPPFNEKLLRFVVVLFSRDSPLSKIEDFKERQKEAANIVGIDYTEETKDVFTGEHPLLIEYLCAFFRLIDDKLWVERISAEHSFYYLTDGMRVPVGNDTDPEKRKAAYQLYKTCLNDANAIREHIKKLDNELAITDDKLFSNVIRNEVQKKATTFEGIEV